MNLIKFIGEKLAGYPGRSAQWPAVRKEWLKVNPYCAACGAKRALEVHHIQPYHLFPSLELVASNLLTLCEGAGNCHLMFGHLGHWKSYNRGVKQDCAEFLRKVVTRP